MDAASLFADVPDPRGRNARHPLAELLFIALAASLCPPPFGGGGLT
jgi:hypothetical protein